MKILLINETERLAASIQELLKQHWYEADVCADGPTGLAALKTGQYDAVLLASTLPGKDGPALLKEIRSCGISIPAVLLTEKNRPSDRITGLEAGADYCLEKPFDTGELLAVIKTVTRRRGELLPDCLSYGNLSLNQTTYCLSGPKTSLQLGRKEYEVMRILLANREIVVSKEMLLAKIWGDRPDAVENNVEIYISFLRKKLECLGANVKIVTMRHFGYHLALK